MDYRGALSNYCPVWTVNLRYLTPPTGKPLSLFRWIRID